MLPRPRTALGGAAGGVVLMALTWFAAVHIGWVERADHAILVGFAGLHRPHVDQVASDIATLCDPKPYLLLAAIPVLVALVRRRPRVAVMVGGIMLAANMTSQVLKPLLATQRLHVVSGPTVGLASWPSGHATAVMSLALCAVLVAPARRRPLVAALMAAFAIAVCYSFLELGWHYPTDVLGGFEVASVWTLVGVAALAWLESRRPATHGPVRSASARGAQVSLAEVLAPVALLVLIALVAAAVLALARPVAVVDYASAHKLFIAGAAGIAALSLAIATAATLALRQSSAP